MLCEQGCASRPKPGRGGWVFLRKLLLRTGQSYGKYMRDQQAYDKLHQNMHENLKHATFR